MKKLLYSPSFLYFFTDFCVHGNLTFKGHCPFGMAVPLIRCTTYTEGNSYSESFIEDSVNSSHASEESDSESSCTHRNHVFKKWCPFVMVVSLTRCNISTTEYADSDSMDHASTSFSTSQGDISNYSEPQESDNEMLSSEFESRINKLKNYQAQIDIQLKHLISLSQQNYVLWQKQEVLKRK